MEDTVKYKRQLRNILIHKPLQRQYTILMIAIMMASTLVISFIIHGTMKQALVGNPYRVGKVSPYELLSVINEQLIMRVSMTLFVAVIVATAIGVVFLHRVAGPVYRFQMILKKMATGVIPNDVKLRDKDFFKEVAGEFNNVFRVLRARKMKAEAIAAELDHLSLDDLPEPIRKTIRETKENLLNL